MRESNIHVDPFKQSIQTQVFFWPFKHRCPIRVHDNTWLIQFKPVLLLTSRISIIIVANLLLGITKPVVSGHFVQVSHFTPKLQTLPRPEVNNTNVVFVDQIVHFFAVHFHQVGACQICHTLSQSFRSYRCWLVCFLLERKVPECSSVHNHEVW